MPLNSTLKFREKNNFVFDNVCETQIVIITKQTISKMNLQCEPILEPIKVIMINPLRPAARLVMAKMLSGAIFGAHQMVNLYLLVYANDLTSAEELKVEIEACALSCNNSIEITSDLPSISDYDVFCFITNFPNPNIFENSPKEVNDYFEDLYLIIKIANNLVVSNGMGDGLKDNYMDIKQVTNESRRKIKPIIIADGLIAIDILHSLSINVPTDVFFCPTPFTANTKLILGEHLNIECNNINDPLVWAANENAFHVEVEKPLIIHDVGTNRSQCDRGVISKDLLNSLNLDHTQFSDSWMKKEFINKVATFALKNPYGCIHKAAEITKTLYDIWLARSGKDGSKVYSNMGVISDGSLGTLKGCPYVLPLVLSGNGFTVSKRYQNDPHLKQEIKKINKEVNLRHNLLIQHCKRILVDNVISEVSATSRSGFGSAY